MWRLLLVVLLVMAGANARAEDDEHLLETPPPQGIPERMQELEREWAEDTGEKQTDVEVPEPTPLDEAHDAARGVEEGPDPDVPAPVPHPEEPPVPKKPASSLESPIRRATPEHPTVRGTPPPAPMERPIVRGTPPPAPKEGSAEAPAKPASRPPTEAED